MCLRMYQTINSGEIKDVLDQFQINYTWENFTEKTYTIASLFSKIENGFYFYSLDENLDLNNSLIIVKNNFSNITGNNQLIKLIKGDPQQIYYKILNVFFGRKSNGLISSSSVFGFKVKIGVNVQIDDFCIIEDKVEIGDNVIIGSHSKVHSNTIIKNNSIIDSGCIIGTQGVSWIWDEGQLRKIIQPQLGGVCIDQNCFIGAGSIIVRGSLNENTEIGEGTLMAPGARIGHGTKIGKFVHFANNVVTGGNTIIGDYSFVGSSAVCRPKVIIHSKTIIGAGSVVVKNTTTEGKTLMGVPAKEKKTKINPSGMPKPKL